MKNFEAVRQAIDSGLRVYWKHESYSVIKDSLGQYLINHKDSCVGLVESEYRAIDFFTNSNPFSRESEGISWLTYEWHLAQDRLREYDSAGMLAGADLINDASAYPRLIAAEKALQRKESRS